MWNNKNTKLFQPGKKKNKSLRMNRARAEVKISEGLGKGPPTIIPARAVLSDFRAHGIDLFVTEDIEMGKEVSLTIDGPRKFFSRGEVVARQEVRNESRIITSQEYTHRVGIRFLFDSEEEKHEAKMFAWEVAGVGKKPDPLPQKEEAPNDGASDEATQEVSGDASPESPETEAPEEEQKAA